MRTAGAAAGLRGHTHSRWQCGEAGEAGVWRCNPAATPGIKGTESREKAAKCSTAQRSANNGLLEHIHNDRHGQGGDKDKK